MGGYGSGCVHEGVDVGSRGRALLHDIRYRNTVCKCISTGGHSKPNTKRHSNRVLDKYVYEVKMATLQPAAG